MNPRRVATERWPTLTFAGGLGCPLEYFHPGFRPALQARWQANYLASYVGQLHRFRTDPSGVFSLKLFWRGLMSAALPSQCRQLRFARSWCRIRSSVSSVRGTRR